MAFTLHLMIFASLLVIPASSVTTEQDAMFGAACVPLIQDNERNIATMVRFIFHDCVGGCDGCIDTELEESTHGDRVNAGLENVLIKLEEAYNSNQVDQIASKADFYAKCGQVAVEAARLRGGFPTTPDDVPIRMRYGREDCNGNPLASAEDFPNPRRGLDHVLDWCASVFNFTQRECVAIMGAHTLGEASQDNSGYDNAWVRNEYGLDNELYRDMISEDWEQENVGGADGTSEARWQFEDSGNMMLNTDMCLLYDITPDFYGKVSEELENTGLSQTASIVEEYSGDNSLWLFEFAETFSKMIESGYEEGELSEVVGGQAAAPDGLEEDASSEEDD